jgi:hypothetical protein
MENRGLHPLVYFLVIAAAVIIVYFIFFPILCWAFHPIADTIPWC